MVRHKLKKVKRPIKRPQSDNTEAVSVPQKITENPFNSKPAEKNDAFNLDSFLEEDKAPVQIQPPAPQQERFIPASLERSFIEDDDVAPQPEGLRGKMMVGDLFTGFAIMVTAGFFLLFGIVFAKLFLSSETPVQQGLQGVVVNSEVPRGRARCGVAEKTQGCVLYIMNPQHQDLNGRDFYDLAAQLTGRQRFMIETGNMRYSSIKIRPGEIAQLNIPPLR